MSPCLRFARLLPRWLRAGLALAALVTAPLAWSQESGVRTMLNQLFQAGELEARSIGTPALLTTSTSTVTVQQQSQSPPSGSRQSSVTAVNWPPAAVTMASRQ